jgi:hypothetical protein
MSVKHDPTLDRSGKIDPDLSKARRSLRKDQKDYAQCWRSDKKPFHRNSMLEPTLQAIQELKQFVHTIDTDLVKRDIFKFNRDLEEERILLAEDLVRRVKPGPYENPQHMKLIAYHAASVEMVNRHKLHIDDRIGSNILLGTIRSSRIDARADTDIGGYTVIHVNSGFIDFLYQAANSVMIVSNPVKAHDGKADLYAHFSDEEIDFELSKNPEPVRLLYETLTTYFYSDYPELSGLENIESEIQRMLKIIYEMSIRFTIAHEYGHHFSKYSTLNKKVAYPLPAWKEELSADQYAMYTTVLSGHWLDHFSPDVSLAGAVLNIACLDMLNEARFIISYGRLPSDTEIESQSIYLSRANDIVNTFHRCFDLKYGEGRNYELRQLPSPRQLDMVDDEIRKIFSWRVFRPANALWHIWKQVQEKILLEYANKSTS